MANDEFIGVRVEGVREVAQAFKYVDRTLYLELRRELRSAAEPVRSTAEQLASGNIQNIGVPWSRMRIGIAGAGSTVYVAPKSRNAGGSKRTNLAENLLNQSMIPALEGHREEVVARLELMLDVIGKKSGLSDA